MTAFTGTRWNAHGTAIRSGCCSSCSIPAPPNEKEDDPTITRCLGFATRWGFGSLVVGNLFALRSPKPQDLVQHSKPVGPDNDFHLQRLAEECQTVVAA